MPDSMKLQAFAAGGEMCSTFSFPREYATDIRYESQPGARSVPSPFGRGLR